MQPVIRTLAGLVLSVSAFSSHGEGARGIPCGANTWALWDAEGQHLSATEVLDIHEKYGANILFFRSESKYGQDLAQIRNAGIALIKVAHPGYPPFNNEDFLASEDRVREWAAAAASNPMIDGIALDMEGPTATHHGGVFRLLAEEAHARGKTFHAVPHFALFDRWVDTVSAEAINRGADVVWPWLYNRFRQPDYGRGILAMLEYWRDNGVTVPTYPIFDHGRVEYSGITPAEARRIPSFLREAGVESICLFQPHISYRSQGDSEDYASLWRDLAKTYGTAGNAE